MRGEGDTGSGTGTGTGREDTGTGPNPDTDTDIDTVGSDDVSSGNPDNKDSMERRRIPSRTPACNVPPAVLAYLWERLQ